MYFRGVSPKIDILRKKDVDFYFFTLNIWLICNVKEMIAMKEDKLSDLSMQLSEEVLKLTKELRARHETVYKSPHSFQLWGDGFT